MVRQPSKKRSRDDLYEAASPVEGLAAERTFLAAERTLLAYLRTAFAMLVAGVTGARLLDDVVLRGLGHALSLASLLVFWFGIFRFRRAEATAQQLLLRRRSTGAKEGDEI